MAKHIFVTGGVVSSLGKGITAASLGRLLRSRGLKVQMQKLDPYINVDPGTMSPYEHGEVFVTEDGAETDLDLGHYERYVDENLTSDCNVTSGTVYFSVINKERRGDYLGKTVQLIPHITNEIKQRIHRVADMGGGVDVVITEIGGTVGDIESLPFLEAIRQFRIDVGRENALYIHVSLVPYLEAAGEQKTKPTQHSVKELRGIGIQPDIIVCRSPRHMNKSLREKIALLCDIDIEAVITAIDAPDIYMVPLILHEEGLDDLVIRKLGIEAAEPDLADWQELVDRINSCKKKVRIALVGKYVQLWDAYMSVIQALKNAAVFHNHELEVVWVDSEDVSPMLVESQLRDVDGVLIPGGFGPRAIEGKVQAVTYARENNIPFLGICLGMQCAVVEYARNVAGMPGANSSEFDQSTPYPVIDLLPEQKDVEAMGGTMRLGSYPCKLSRSGKAVKAYGERTIHERHRHRYEVNNALRPKLVEAGMKITGTSPDKRLVEIIELTGHPWFVATQFHPEFKSRPTRPHPLFRDFVGAAVNQSDAREAGRAGSGHHGIGEAAPGTGHQDAGDEDVASTDLIDEAR
ncbi:MAG: CTP synthase [Actinobacteria bacterium]|nr:CTP synthase [Actinomycetota bacterium]